MQQAFGLRRPILLNGRSDSEDVVPKSRYNRAGVQVGGSSRRSFEGEGGSTGKRERGPGGGARKRGPARGGGGGGGEGGRDEFRDVSQMSCHKRPGAEELSPTSRHEHGRTSERGEGGGGAGVNKGNKEGDQEVGATKKGDE